MAVWWGTRGRDDGARPLDAAYRAFVTARGDGARVWHDADFLEAIVGPDGPERWRYVSLERDGRTVAVLPYCEKRRVDGWVIIVPAFGRYVGPLWDAEWLGGVDGVRAYEALLGEIPKHYVSQELCWGPWDMPEAKAAAPSANYQCGKRPTYAVDVSQGEVAIWEGLHRSMRKRLRRAVRHQRLQRGAINSEVLDVLAAPFLREGGRLPYDPAVFKRVYASLQARGRVVSHQAVSESGEVLAASLAVADTQAVYCLASGSLPAARGWGGGSYILFEDVLWGQQLGVSKVDFLGSEIESIAENRRQLGGEICSYPFLYRDTGLVARARRRWANRMKG